MASFLIGVALVLLCLVIVAFLIIAVLLKAIAVFFGCCEDEYEEEHKRNTQKK